MLQNVEGNKDVTLRENVEENTKKEDGHDKRKEEGS